MRGTLCVVLLALLPVGCSGPAIHPVRGTVRFPDGSPVPAGRVALDTGDALTGSWGAIQPDGTFVMGTHTPRDGVPPGTFRVYIVGAVSQPASDGAAVEPKPLVHERFTRPETSGLSFTVPDQTTWDIVVEKPAKVR